MPDLGLKPLEQGDHGDTSRKGNLRTLRTAGPGSGRPERAEAAFGHSLIGVPEIVARQADVLPVERRDVLEQGRIDGLGFPKQGTPHSGHTVLRGLNSRQANSRTE